MNIYIYIYIMEWSCDGFNNSDNCLWYEHYFSYTGKPSIMGEQDLKLIIYVQRNNLFRFVNLYFTIILHCITRKKTQDRTKHKWRSSTYWKRVIIKIPYYITAILFSHIICHNLLSLFIRDVLISFRVLFQCKIISGTVFLLFYLWYGISLKQRKP